MFSSKNIFRKYFLEYIFRIYFLEYIFIFFIINNDIKLINKKYSNNVWINEIKIKIIKIIKIIKMNKNE